MQQSTFQRKTPSSPGVTAHGVDGCTVRLAEMIQEQRAVMAALATCHFDRAVTRLRSDATTSSGSHSAASGPQDGHASSAAPASV